MDQVGRNLERDALRRIQQVTRFLEPAFLLFLSLLVGGLLLAYLLPMVQLLEEAGGGQF
jgi:type II secretory pathway component PulF